MDAQPRTTTSWLSGIEALRGVAAITVVLHHAYTLADRPALPGGSILEGFGSFGVALFFVLSAFLLAGQTFKRKELSLVDFWLRRFFRIAPAYYVTVTILFLFFASHTLVFSQQGLLQSLSNLTFTHYLFPTTSSSLNVNGALWTLTIEATLYLVLPALGAVFSRFPLATFTTLVVVGLAWRLIVAFELFPVRLLVFGTQGPGAEVEILYLARQFVGFLPLFALGMGTRWLVDKGHARRLTNRLPRKLGMPVLLLLLIPAVAISTNALRAADYQHWLWFTSFDTLLGLTIAPIILVTATLAFKNEGRLARGAAWLGTRSYSLYIWHFPIILTFYGRGAFATPASMPAPLAQAIGAILVSIVFAHFSYRFIELPGIAAGKHAVNRRSIRAARSRPTSPSAR